MAIQSSILIKPRPSSFLFHYNLSTSACGSMHRYIVSSFLVFLSISLKSSFVQLTIPALYRTVTTAHEFIDSIVFFPLRHRYVILLLQFLITILSINSLSLVPLLFRLQPFCSSGRKLSASRWSYILPANGQLANLPVINFHIVAKQVWAES